MKRNKIRYDRWLRTLFLAFALLTGGGGWMVWGQQKNEISLTQKDHSKVHTEEKTIYVQKGEDRILSIPVLNVNNRSGQDNTYNWFVHWYVQGKDGSKGKGSIKHYSTTITNTNAGTRGGWIQENPNGYTTKDYFAKVKETGGLIWSYRLKTNKKVNGLGIDAATIAYNLPESETDIEDIVWCDISAYMDGDLKDNQYTEPTLSKRYKFVIKNATECLSYDNDETKKDIYKIDYPEESPTINISMPYTPDNYFWQDGVTIYQGTKFEYKINDDNWTPFTLITRNEQIELQRNQKIKIEQLKTSNELNGGYNTVSIKAVCETDKQSKKSMVIAEFQLYPLSKDKDSYFKFEKEIAGTDDEKQWIIDKTSDRWPRGNSTKYQQIGWVDFDQNNVKDNIASGDNMSNNPVGTTSIFDNAYAETSYGFIGKDWKSLTDKESNCFTSSPGMYGLFRSANINVSEDGQFCSNSSEVNRKYKWIPALYDKSTGSNWTHNHVPTAWSKKYDQRYLYDRTYHINSGQDGGNKYGYFYYIDATDEPGVLVSVPITGTICENTELTVTGWVADMTRPCLRGGTPLPPNLNVLFKGKKGNGEDVILHWFTTGDARTNYIDMTAHKDCGNKYNIYLMEWQQFHYKFVVSKELYEQCDPNSFRLEVQNNEPHTDGADYAIDDIRIFKTIPDVKVVQSGNPCDEKIKTVKFKTNYKMLLRNLGLTEEQPINSNIATPLSFDEYSQLSEEHALKKYFKDKDKQNIEEALKYFTTIYYAIYNTQEEDGEIKPDGNPIQIEYNGKEPSNYRTSYVSTRIEDMVWTDESASSATRNPEDGYITSTNVSINGELTANKTYIARVSKTPISGKCEICSFFNSFVLEGVGDRIEVTQNGTAVDITEASPNGNAYTITGILKYNPNPNSDELISVENPKFDWFLGTWDEFVKPGTITANSKSYSIMEALQAAYHNAGEDQDGAIKNELNKLVRTDDNSNGTLILKVTSFNFIMTGPKHWGVMFPRAKQDGLPEGAVICSDPHEFLLGGTPPTIEPGDPNVPDPEDPDPDDPEDPDPKDPDPDKPKPDENPFDGSHVRSVRVGLVQIQDMQQHDGTLRIPIHVRTSSDEEKFAKQEGKNKSDIIVYKTSDGTWNSNTAVVATLETLVDNSKKADWETNYFTIKFTEKAKEFKEGFWYMVGIPYKVINTDNKDIYVDRVFMLTLKIVPEYVTWVGSESGMHNWNNDGPKHWRRSKNGELYMGKDGELTGAQANGNHAQAYTPMRFTKVTVADNGTTPYSAYPHLYKLEKNTGNQEKDPKNVLLNMDVPINLTTENIGAATKNIEYDLLADPDYEKELFGNDKNPDIPKDGSVNHNYACVRFYGNTCDEIYIKPESEILHTEYLTYNKAHVDYEMAPNRWYMLASPLKGVVSGDMYLPTVENKVGKYARQETPAFGEINYVDNTQYTRWEPPVYMRGWDKITATVVRSDGTKPSYGIRGSWSNLYNDVDVPFTPGTGFSIGTKTDKNFTGNVLFRLPKADTKYTYYGSNGTGGVATTLTNRDDNGRFYFSDRDKDGNKSTEKLPVTFIYDESKGMIGNPFMSHLNMKEFFKENNSSGNTYYIMTETGTNTNILGKDYSISTEDKANPQFIAPLQSFIVPDLASATFTTDMIAKASTDGTNIGLRSATVAPAEEHLPQLRITATRDGIRNTAVVAGLATASDSYVEGEDAALLINEEVAAPQVYTLAGNQMVAINVTPDLAEIPVGIHGKDATPVELSFKLSGAMKNVKLVDKQTGKRYDVTDGLTLTVPGNTSGRYFLNGSIATSNEIIARNHIIFYNSAPGRIDVSSVDALSEVTVYDISGRALRTLRNLNTPTASVDHLAPGIYVVRAESGSQVVSEKVEVR